MTKDIIWKTFEKTGDLNTYLLFKEVESIDIMKTTQGEIREEGVKSSK